MKDKLDQLPDLPYRKIGAAVLVILGVLLLIAPALLDRYTMEDVVERDYETSVNVVNASNTENLTVGVDTGSGLGFGRMPVEAANNTKFIDIGTPSPMDLEVKTRAEGNITEFLKYKDRTYFDQLNGTGQIPVEISPTRLGNFSGTVSIDVRKPKGGLGKAWLDVKSSLY